MPDTIQLKNFGVFHSFLFEDYKLGSCFVQTMMEADIKGDGKIDLEEWKEFAGRNPAILKSMTLPYLKYVLKAYIEH